MTKVVDIDGTDELNIQHAILQLMIDRRIWSNAELKAKLDKLLPLTPEDRAVGARTNESVWENRVNNALSPSRSSSLYSKGHVTSEGHGLHRITSEGVRFISDGDFDIDEMVSKL